ncbi:MAG TPA: carboxypeptidase-like regulatory domain-containing protein [Thermoanaerobaculia bacterium]|nr:carboxypeptidase-like regulatory domain-containing protein [Thermoanaerobaculia bacterium]
MKHALLALMSLLLLTPEVRAAGAGPEPVRPASPERRIELKEGNEAKVDFRFARIPRVHGRVLDSDGRPAAKVPVTFAQGDQEVHDLSGPDGAFETHLPEGTWEVRARRPGFGPSPLFSFTVAAKRSETSIEIPPLQLTEPVAVSGRILGLRPGESAGFVAVRTESGKRKLGPRHVVRTTQENRFEFWDLGPGAWTLEATLENRTALSTVQIAPGQKTARVDLDFGEGKETLAGQVLGGKGEEAWVEARRLEEPGLEIYVELSPDDRFEISSLPPGRYRVQVLNRHLDRVRTLTEVMAEVPGKPVVIDLRERKEGTKR